ncbi:MAG: hypothetical protein ABFR50_01010 [Candidatus Fermentibacteria bacterium]
MRERPFKVVSDFEGGSITSDGGGLLLREVDHRQKNRISAELAEAKSITRRKGSPVEFLKASGVIRLNQLIFIELLM